MFIQKNKKQTITIILLFLVSLILFSKPLFSFKPLGFDALGHLSKVSYLKEFGYTSWNHAWYSGKPLLEYYPPLMYILGRFIPNSIFTINLLCFISIFLTSLGIFFIVKHHSNIKSGLISATSFLSILAISYYYIAVGNHPFVFALFTIPFSLFFLEKSLTNRKYYIPFILVATISILSHVFVSVLVFSACTLRILFLRKKFKKKTYLIITHIIPAGLLSALWWVPFLSKSSSFKGGDAGYIPAIHHLFGFGNYIIFGKSPGELGLTFAIFIFLVLIYLIFFKKIKKRRYINFILLISILLFIPLSGGLGKYYPFGVGAPRFVLPFAIFMSIFIGLSAYKAKIKKNILYLIYILIVISLIWQLIIINNNFKNHSYNTETSRYGFMKQYHEILPFNNSFENYRFGTSHYIFGETLTFFKPYTSQTMGYYEQGMLYPETNYLIIESIWKSKNLNSTLYFLDYFGIKYFEFEKNSELNKKFQENLFFKKMQEDFYDYPFIIYEYKEPKSIISYFQTSVYSVERLDKELIKKDAELNKGLKTNIPIISKEKINISKKYKELEYNWERKGPDEIKIIFNKGEEGIILFKELYHDSWKAQDSKTNKQMNIYSAGPNMMLVIPDKESTGIIFKQTKTSKDYLGLTLTFIGIILVILFFKRPYFITKKIYK